MTPSREADKSNFWFWSWRTDNEDIESQWPCGHPNRPQSDSSCWMRSFFWFSWINVTPSSLRSVYPTLTRKPEKVRKWVGNEFDFDNTFCLIGSSLSNYIWFGKILNIPSSYPSISSTSEKNRCIRWETHWSKTISRWISILTQRRWTWCPKRIISQSRFKTPYTSIIILINADHNLAWFSWMRHNFVNFLIGNRKWLTL